MNPTVCPNCETTLNGSHCHNCGQKVFDPKERTLKHLVIQFLGSAFFLENNFLKNLWTLLSKPGQQALDFMEGRRKRWMPPFSLFLLINLFYFWYTPLTDLNLRLGEQMNQFHHCSLAKSLVDKKLKSENITLQEFSERYDAKRTNYANTLIILQIPIFALLMGIIFFRNGYFFADHFMMGIYFFAFVLLGALMIFRVPLLFPGTENYWSIVSFVFSGSLVVYLMFAIRRFYKRKWWATILLTAPAFFAFAVTHFAYRTLLFLVIYLVA